MGYRHVPVLVEETVRALNLSSNKFVIDGTVGGGGHATAILEQTAPQGKLLAFDRDVAAIEAAREHLEKFNTRVQFIHDSFSQLAVYVKRLGIAHVDGVLLDLGFSSAQLEDSTRGFSYQLQGELDLRFDISTGKTAAELLQTLSAGELEDMLRTYGEEPRARALARAIVETRRSHPFQTTGDLLAVVLKVKGRGRRSLHPATLVWQALRIAVNSELNELSDGLEAALDVLSPGGRLAVISFHSGEDRLVKQWIRRSVRACHCPSEAPVCSCDGTPRARLVYKKPVVASRREAVSNPRARSAKLRVIEKI
jgi:16S rRNA (cytosine1402-N4)-methyltransferase